MTVRLGRRVFAAAGGAALASIAFTRSPLRGAQFSWRFASTNTAEHPANVAIVGALARIDRETNGGFHIQPFVNSALGTDSAAVAQLRLGAIECMMENGGAMDTVVPLASIESVAFAFPDHKTAFAAMDGDVGRLVREQFPARGFIGLERPLENGFRYFTSGVRPIRTPDDLLGLKFRVSPGKLYFDTFRSLGVNIAAVNLNELYVALQTHLVDAQETPLASIENLHLYEVQKYGSLSRHMWSGYWFLINQAKWDSLPRDYQEVMRKYVNAAAVQQRLANIASETALRDKLGRQGMPLTPIDAPSFKAKLVASGYYGRWREAYGAEAWTALEKYSGPLKTA